MTTFKNSNGCCINMQVSVKSDFTGSNWKLFTETISHQLIDIVFNEGRKIYLQICGCRSLLIPKKCKTIEDVANWINTKDF